MPTFHYLSNYLLIVCMSAFMLNRFWKPAWVRALMPHVTVSVSSLNDIDRWWFTYFSIESNIGIYSILYSTLTRMMCVECRGGPIHIHPLHIQHIPISLTPDNRLLAAGLAKLCCLFNLMHLEGRCFPPTAAAMNENCSMLTSKRNASRYSGNIPHVEYLKVESSIARWIRIYRLGTGYIPKPYVPPNQRPRILCNAGSETDCERVCVTQ